MPPALFTGSTDFRERRHRVLHFLRIERRNLPLQVREPADSMERSGEIDGVS